MKIGFNEGSLLRRTLLHVGTFMLGSLMIVGLASLVLTSIVKGIVHPAGAAEPAVTSETRDESAPGKGLRPPVKPVGPHARQQEPARNE